MPQFGPIRYADFVRYDAASGTLQLIDPRQETNEPAQLTEVADALDVLAAWAQVDMHVHGCAAAFVLALVAREWHGRPTDAQRGALIQMATTLEDGNAVLARPLLADILAAADAALLAGEHPERAIVDRVNERLRKADRAAGRCGRHGAGLLDAGDQVVTWGFGGVPLLSLLAASVETQPDLGVLAVAAEGASAGANLLVRLVSAAGITPRLIESEQAAAISVTSHLLCVVGTLGVAMDGSAVSPRGVGALIEWARQQHLPCYLLAPEGPMLHAAAAQDLVAERAEVDVVQPELISAFVTDRGLYRPPMIGRYLDEGEAPLDVIPLLNG